MAEKRPLKFIGALGVGLFILCIPIFLVTSDLRWAVNEVRLYEYGFSKYDVSEETGLSDGELLEVAQELIHYVNTGEWGEDLEIFNDREVAHLKDVKGLIQLCYHLQEATFGYLIVFTLGGFFWQRKRFTPSLARMMAGGSILTIALLLVVGIAALVNFQWLFGAFHRLFFSGDSWILSGYLPRIFTEGFFSDAALLIIGAVVVEALVIGAIGGFFVLRGRRARG
ncbi:MAG: TIGR01906 family membrane protein [Dehalococcoidia bacterium]|nr:TIGR01906 family membrane protein [Dehalococcoidia bacterium]